MVNLSPEEQCRARHNVRLTVCLDNANVKTNIHFRRSPAGLSDLEKYADMLTVYMQNMSSKQNVRQFAMDQLRQLFNLEFKIRCDVCGTAHYQDEITAPER